MADRQNTELAFEPVEPWYRQFWPWFLIVLPGSVVVASFFMLYLAIKHADTLVSDNYYRDGLALNQVLSQDARARELALSAQLVFNIEQGVLTINFIGTGKSWIPRSETLTLLLLHPTDAGADHMISVSAGGEGRYRGRLPSLPKHRFYLRLLPGKISDGEEIKSAKWRLNGEIDLSSASRVALGIVNSGDSEI